MPRKQAQVVQEESPIYLSTVSLVCEVHAMPAPIQIDGPESVVAQLKKIRTAPKEHFVALMLNTRHHLLKVETISIGTLNASLVHPREVFRPALECSAAAIILAHNHPSGDPAHSEDDYRLTERLMKAGKILGIEILDHVIVARHSYLSMKVRHWPILY